MPQLPSTLNKPFNPTIASSKIMFLRKKLYLNINYSNVLTIASSKDPAGIQNLVFGRFLRRDTELAESLHSQSISRIMLMLANYNNVVMPVWLFTGLICFMRFYSQKITNIQGSTELGIF